jgi:RNA polymerase sigma-54 factor
MNPRNRISVSPRARQGLQTGLVNAIGLMRLGTDDLARYLEEQAAQNAALILDHAEVTLTDTWPRWRGRGTGPVTDTADMIAAVGPSLMAHVMATVERLFPKGAARKIALALADRLEPSGWLPPDAITDDAALAVLRGLQAAGPAGLFARGLSECLRLQALDAGVMDAVLGCMIDHLDLLASGQVARLARMCGVDDAAIQSRLRVIRSFDPKPGTQFSAAPTTAREPELVLRQGESGLTVGLNRHALPEVRIDPARPLPQVADARLVRRMVVARRDTLLRVATAMAARQAGRLTHSLGDAAPMTMEDVAGDLGLHPSTLSRVVAGTAIDTPWGTRLLRDLFGAEVTAGLSAVALRERVALAVAAEDRAAPLSDDAIVARLSLDGLTLSRRTVAKYRAMLHIPPAHRRKVLRAGRG